MKPVLTGFRKNQLVFERFFNPCVGVAMLLMEDYKTSLQICRSGRRRRLSGRSGVSGGWGREKGRRIFFFQNNVKNINLSKGSSIFKTYLIL
jgi:hypothetical protein